MTNTWTMRRRSARTRGRSGSRSMWTGFGGPPLRASCLGPHRRSVRSKSHRRRAQKPPRTPPSRSGWETEACCPGIPGRDRLGPGQLARIRALPHQLRRGQVRTDRRDRGHPRCRRHGDSHDLIVRSVQRQPVLHPDDQGRLPVELPATEDCEAQGAICTEDDTMLSSPLEFTVKGPPLTASFESNTSVLYLNCVGKSGPRWPGFGQRSWSRQRAWGLRW